MRSSNFNTLHLGAFGVLFDEVKNEFASWCLNGSEVVASGSVGTASSVCNSPFKGVWWRSRGARVPRGTGKAQIQSGFSRLHPRLLFAVRATP